MTLDSDQSYRLLFDAIDQGVCVCQVIVDERGRARDYRFLEVNAAFERETGLHDAVGRTALELVPGLEQHWIDVYGSVAITRQPIRFEDGSAVMGRWFEVYAFPFGDPASLTFAVLFKDVTQKKRISERLAFLADVDRELQLIDDPDEILTTTAQLLGRHLGTELRMDVADGTAEALSVPLYRKGQLLANVSVQESVPRQWSPDDIELVQMVVQRCWASIERAHAHESLRASEQRFREMFETAALSIWEEDFSDIRSAIDALRADGVSDFRAWFAAHPEFVENAIQSVRITDVNPATLRLFGAATREELLQSLGTIFVPETRHVFVEELLTIAEERRMYEAETTLRRLDGSTIDVLFSIRFPSAEDSFARVIVSLIDITERKRSENALRASELRFREMADNAPVMVWITDTEGRCTFLSKPWYDFTGQTPATGLGFGWLEAVHPEDREHSGRVFRDSHTGRTAFRVEYRLRRANGEYRWALDSALPRIGENGEYLGYIGSVIDITERKEAEEALRQSAEALQEADRLKDEFLATLSHELRTPLTAILGWSQMISDGHVAEGDVHVGLEAIARSAKVQLALVEDVLDLSRITTGKMRLDKRPSDVRQVIDAAIDTVRPAADAKRITLRCEMAPLGIVSIDPDRLQQVVWNLLSNAVKFTPPQGTVQVTASRSGGNIVITVTDNGIGIAAGFLPYVFQPFRQADSSSRRAHSGLGLGLALSRDLVELHGGTIHAESEEGHGARFTVMIPV